MKHLEIQLENLVETKKYDVSVSEGNGTLDLKGWDGVSNGENQSVSLLGTGLNVISVEQMNTWAAVSYKQLIQVSGAAINDKLGYSVSIYENTAAIAAPGANSTKGTVHIYKRIANSWVHDQTLSGSDSANSSYFGQSLHIHENSLIIGVIYDNQMGSAAGAAYIFARPDADSYFTEQKKLLMPDAEAGDRAGQSVGIYEDTAVVGAWGEDTGGNDKGAIYIFTRTGTTWDSGQKKQDSLTDTGDRMGYAVAIWGDYISAGAIYQDTGGNDVGLVRIFQRTSGKSWNVWQAIQPSDRQTFQRFGYSLAMDETTIVVGAYTDSHIVSGGGSIYVFEKGVSWYNETFKEQSGTPNSHLGSSVSVHGDTIVAGEPDTGGGQARLYRREGGSWEFSQLLSHSAADSGDDLGWELAVHGNLVLIGCPEQDTGATNGGAAFSFTP